MGDFCKVNALKRTHSPNINPAYNSHSCIEHTRRILET